MSSDLITAVVGLGGIALGVVGTLVGARIQAHGSLAQADATVESAWAQNKETYKNWMASDRAHTYSSMITETLTLEGKATSLTADFNSSGHPWWYLTWKPRGYEARMAEYTVVSVNFVRLRWASALVDLYGDETVRECGAQLVHTAEAMRRLTSDWVLDPTTNSPAEGEHVGQLREQRRLFTAAAREHLVALSRPTA
ncbi:hypothetical protein ACFYPT_18100 [Streptomyces sp. NPDC005529]|uniref:hypothetical protein n=1 Tax=unclassified Streptomyces TaxID=2593676 RepID=UPI0033BA3B32